MDYAYEDMRVKEVSCEMTARCIEVSERITSYRLHNAYGLLHMFIIHLTVLYNLICFMTFLH